MATNSLKSSGNRRTAWIPALALLAVIAAYATQSLLALYQPDWLPGESILQVAALGPTTLLGWGGGTSTLYWICTAVLVVVAVAGAAFPKLQLPAALLFFAVWMGRGFFSVALSV